MKQINDLWPSMVLPLGDVETGAAAPEGVTLDKGLNVFECRTGKGNAEVRVNDSDSMAFMDDVGTWYFASDPEGENSLAVDGVNFDNQVDLTYSVGEDPDRPNYNPGEPDADLPMLPENSTVYLCINAKRDGAVFNASIRVQVWRDEADPIPLPDGYANLDGKVYKLTEV